MPEQKELLFVCSAGENRSPIGAQMFNDLLGRDGLAGEYHASSAGWLANRPTAQQVTDAYGIFACDNGVSTAIEKECPGAGIKVRNLQIPDVYDASSPSDAAELKTMFTTLYDTGEWKYAVWRRKAFCFLPSMGP